MPLQLVIVFTIKVIVGCAMRTYSLDARVMPPPNRTLNPGTSLHVTSWGWYGSLELLKLRPGLQHLLHPGRGSKSFTLWLQG